MQLTGKIFIFETIHEAFPFPVLANGTVFLCKTYLNLWLLAFLVS